MPEDVFVNRETELERFRTAAHPNSKPVLVLCGEGGVGKTALRRRMETECAKPDVAMRKIVIEWRSTRPYDYLGIMSSIADCHDDSEFADFRQLLARIESAEREVMINLQAGGIIDVASRASFTEVREVRAAAVNIERLVVGSRQNGLGTNRMTRLTDAFLRGLEAVSSLGLVMIFLDAFEMADHETKEWVWNEFARALDSPELRRVRLTILTREQPTFGPHLRQLIDVLPVAPLASLYVAEYMRMRGIVLPSDDLLQQVAFGVIAGTSGNMMNIAAFVEAMLTKQNRAPLAA